MASKTQLARQARLRAVRNNPNVQRFLSVIAKAEGGESYYQKFGGGRIASLDKHPAVFYKFKGRLASPAGRYQITKTSYDDVGANQLGLTDFREEAQDLIALRMIELAGALDDVVRGDFETAKHKTSGRWEAFALKGYSRSKAKNSTAQFKKYGTHNLAPTKALSDKAFGTSYGISAGGRGPEQRFGVSQDVAGVEQPPPPVPSYNEVLGKFLGISGYYDETAPVVDTTQNLFNVVDQPAQFGDDNLFGVTE